MLVGLEMMIDGVRLHYERRGQGPVVLLLHGYGGSIASFAPVMDWLVARNNEAIALDFPGMGGQSGTPDSPWSVTEYAALTRKFLDELAIPTCDIIAHSFGGRVAIIMAAQDKQRIRRLLLTAAAGLLPKRSLAYYVKIYSYKLGKRLAKIPAINKAFALDQKMIHAGSEEYRQLQGTMRATYVRVVNQNLKPYLPQISAPTLLIWGSEDTATPLWMGETMEREIPDAALIVFQGASHFAYLEELQRFCRIADAFLTRDEQ